MNILFTCAGRRNYLINYFKETLNGKGKVFAADMQLSAPSLADADQAIIVKSVNHSDYIDDLLSICSKNKIDAIISLNDIELPILAQNKDRFKEIGVTVIVPYEKVVDQCFDKYKTIEFAKSNGIKTPTTYTNLEKAISAIELGGLHFPVVVKPRWGSASIGLEFPEDINELKLAYQLIDYRLDRTIIADVSKSDRKNAILIQQKVKGKEYGLDIINDLNGDNQAVIVKEKLAMRSGETDKAKTVQNAELESIGRLIGENLGHIGNLDCDIMEENGEYYLIEMNPRFGGGYPFSHEAGANVPKAIIHWLNDEEAPRECFEVEYEKAYSKCDRLIELELD